MPDEVRTSQASKVTVTGELRTGFCEQCRTQTEKEFYMDGERKRVRMVCPSCGGMGRLIVKTTAIQAPKPLTSLSFKDFRRFFRDCIFNRFFAEYHHLRVAYAQSHRNKIIPDRYRTGLPMPVTISQALRENLLLIVRR